MGIFDDGFVLKVMNLDDSCSSYFCFLEKLFYKLQSTLFYKLFFLLDFLISYSCSFLNTKISIELTTNAHSPNSLNLFCGRDQPLPINPNCKASNLLLYTYNSICLF